MSGNLMHLAQPLILGRMVLFFLSIGACCTSQVTLSAMAARLLATDAQHSCMHAGVVLSACCTAPIPGHPGGACQWLQWLCQMQKQKRAASGFCAAGLPGGAVRRRALVQCSTHAR